jgi:hypothetical protein
MRRATDNPFRDAPQPRDITITFRVTKAEHDAIVAKVGTKRGAIKNLIREGIALALDRRQSAKRDGK